MANEKHFSCCGALVISVYAFYSDNHAKVKL